MDFDTWFKDTYGKEPWPARSVEELAAEVERLERVLAKFRMELHIKKTYHAAKRAAWNAWQWRQHGA